MKARENSSHTLDHNMSRLLAQAMTLVDVSKYVIEMFSSTQSSTYLNFSELKESGTTGKLARFHMKTFLRMEVRQALQSNEDVLKVFTSFRQKKRLRNESSRNVEANKEDGELL